MEMNELLNKYYRDGEVSYIGVRPARREKVMVLGEVNAIAGKGLEGDRYSSNGIRQVTLIQEEHLKAISSFLGGKEIDPGLTRRNIVVRGINLITLKGQRFRIGKALLEYSGECHPCSRMEENLGEGGYNAIRGHGGITARIIESGLIRTGDAVVIEKIIN
jgi:MOSC domain-containing protein YiiM